MIILLFIILAIISLGLLLWQISNMVSVFYGSPYVMADKKVISEALRLAKLKKGETFYDLGCGRGDVLIEAAKIGAKAIGFEISPYYYLLAKLKTSIWRIYYPFTRSSKKMASNNIFERISIRHKNIYSINLAKADVVYVYLLPKMLEKLTPKFKRELRKGNRLISIGFPIKNIPGTKHIIATRKIYIHHF